MVYTIKGNGLKKSWAQTTDGWVLAVSGELPGRFVGLPIVELLAWAREQGHCVHVSDGQHAKRMDVLPDGSIR